MHTLSKLILAMITLIGFSYAWGDPFLTKPSNKIPSFTVPKAAPGMSPTEFQSQVTTMSNQNKSQLDQQVSALLPKTPLASPSTAPKPLPQTTATTTTSQLPAEPDAPSYTAPAPSYPQPTRAAPPPPMPATGSYSTTPSTAPQPQGYTGFVAPSKNSGGNTNTGTTKSSSSGGWNIKY